MFKVIIAFLKKHWKWAAIGGVAGYLLFQAYDCSRLLIQQAAWNAADAKYAATIAGKDKIIADGKTALATLAEKAGEDREKYRALADAEVARTKNALAALKSETAEQLRKRQATINEVLSEKEKDELAMLEVQESLIELKIVHEKTLAAWKTSDEAKDIEFKATLAALDEKYTICETWRLKLEKKNRSSTWKSILKIGKTASLMAAAYAAGRAL